MRARHVLISGAGIAGATLAHWLVREGFRVTLLERSKHQRSSGNPVDIRGAAFGVVQEMGLVPELRARATTVRRTVVVGTDGTPRTRIATQNVSKGPGDNPEIEIPRADLAGVLVDAVAPDVEILWDMSIRELDDRGGAVEVALESGGRLTADLVIGADGVHSRTRELAFDPRATRRTHLGLYVGTTRAPELHVQPEEVQMYNEPGRMVSIHPGNGSPIIAYLFRRKEIPSFDPGDAAAHQRLISEEFNGAGWRVPELLGYTLAADDVYLDAVAHVQVAEWSVGRVGLVGDAASCVSLLGDGSSKAIIGAHTLAAELAASTDHVSALRRYQHRHQRRIASPPSIRAAARFLVPRRQASIVARDAMLRTAGRGAELSNNLARRVKDRSGTAASPGGVGTPSPPGSRRPASRAWRRRLGPDGSR